MEKTAILTRDDLERLRKKAGFRRQEDFATACGVSASACRHWLSGARPLPIYAVHVLKMSLWIKEYGGDPTAIGLSPPRERLGPVDKNIFEYDALLLVGKERAYAR